VFNAIVERARRLCWADAATIHIATEHNFTMVHSVGLRPDYLELASREPVPRDRTSLVGRVGMDGRTQQIVDVLADPDYNRPEFQSKSGIRTIMGAPMIVEDDVVGVLSVWRTTVDPFDDRVNSLPCGTWGFSGRWRAARTSSPTKSSSSKRSRRWVRRSARPWTPTRC
jgi:hypothetical protein